MERPENLNRQRKGDLQDMCQWAKPWALDDHDAQRHLTDMHSQNPTQTMHFNCRKDCVASCLARAFRKDDCNLVMASHAVSLETDHKRDEVVSTTASRDVFGKSQENGRFGQLPELDKNAAVHSRNLKIFIGGVEYERVVFKDPASRTKGSAIFYSNHNSDIPYQILTYDVGLVAEYRLVSFRDKNLPTQLFLRLSQAILVAHERNIVLGTDLNLGNIEYDVSKGKDGLPCVTIKNLPPTIVAEHALKPVSEVKVPELDSQPERSTKESDIYSGACTFLQIIERVEEMVYIQRPVEIEGIKEFEYCPSLSHNEVPFLLDEVRIPLVVRRNRRLMRIVNQCLSPEPADRPTASALCHMLLSLCRVTMIRQAGVTVAKSIISGIRRLTP